jgi:predicted DsbA family dithiol-disulfide isomerase
MERVQVTHFSDVLCVWAYVSQVRCDELVAQLGDQVGIDYRYFQVFGSVRKKLEAGWSERGGIPGYAAHVREVASGFEHVEVHPDVWVAATPESSMPGHLFLCAIRLLEEAGDVEPGTLARAAWAVREEFFARCGDIAVRSVLLAIGERVGVAPARVESLLSNGSAHAALSSDLELAREYTVRASPTIVLNEGRQQLTGNVGYRVIEANIRELIERPQGGHSWC